MGQCPAEAFDELRRRTDRLNAEDIDGSFNEFFVGKAHSCVTIMRPIPSYVPKRAALRLAAWIVMCADETQGEPGGAFDAMLREIKDDVKETNDRR